MDVDEVPERIDPKNACRIEDLRSMSMHTSALKMEKKRCTIEVGL